MFIATPVYVMFFLADFCLGQVLRINYHRSEKTYNKISNIGQTFFKNCQKFQKNCQRKIVHKLGHKFQIGKNLNLGKKF